MHSICKAVRAEGIASAALTLLATLLLSLSIPTQAQTYNINFPAPTTFRAVVDNGCQYCPTTVAVAAGDLNGDGKLDVVNIDSDLYLNAMLGNGDGTFQTPVSLYVNGSISAAYAIAVGDFNGDHILDVAVWGAGNPNTNSAVQIFLGNGNGTFTAGNSYTAPNSNSFNSGPSSLAAVDVNSDGKLDIVAMSPYNGVYVFMGNGDGTLQAPVNYPTVNPNGPNQGVAVADLNGDGHPDLAIGTANGIDILLNNGNGAFGAGTYYASGVAGDFSGQGIAIGDLNGDKKPDVVVTEENAGFIIFLNQGGGVFKETGVVSGPFVSATSNILLADINNDKKLDAVVPDAFGNVYTFLGTGKGTFTTGGAYALEVYGSGNSLVALGDFNNDGALDLLDTANNTTSSVSLGRGDGTFQTAQFYNFAGPSQAQTMVVADFNGDGFPDVAAQGIPNGSVGVILGSSHGALTAKPVYTTVCTNCFVYGIAAGDVNGDGKQDLVATTSVNNTVSVMFGTGTGKFGKPKNYPTGASAQEMQIYLVDVNGDGKLDIVTSNADGSISVLVNKGSGTFAAPVLITSLDSLTQEDDQLTFADFNGDGKMDIAVAANPARTNAQAVYVLLGNGNGTFASPITTTTGYFMQSLVAGDFNGDGKQDLFVTTTNWGCAGTVDGVAPGSGYQYLQGRGDGTFGVSAQTCLPWASPVAPVAADFNADGKLDVAVPYGRNSQFNGVAIFQGAGNGTFTPNQDYYPGYAIAAMGVGDFNGDGMPDVAMVNFDSYFSVLLNATQPVSISPLNVNWGSVNVGSKKTETVILTNDQMTSLAINSLTIGGTDAGDFSETSNCGSSRKAGWDCTITVTFKPTATGARSATLSIKDGAGTQTLQLSGTGK
jgi:adhesin/invasin